MEGMMLHCGAKEATLDDLADVELPPKTSSYVPVAHDDLVFNVQRAVNKLLPEYHL